jgi:hypothetical protein
MELNLRKARKLEAKILTYINAMKPNSSVRVRVLATEEERNGVLAKGREKYLSDVNTRSGLLVTRFMIRQQIAEANHSTGINALINRREELQSLLALSIDDVDTLDQLEANDLAAAKKSHLEKGESRFSEASVTFSLPVALKEDVSAFKNTDSLIKKRLEDIEDQLSQKNLGAKIKLSEETVSLLQSVGLV